MAYPQNNLFAQQAMNNQIMLVPVQGESWAQMYPVAAGTTVALIDFESGFFWLKNTAQMRKFEFKEIVQAAPGNENAVTRQEFDELKKMIAALGGKLNEQSVQHDAEVSNVRK